MCVGLSSIVIALTLPVDQFWIAGPVYGLQGPLHWRNGVLLARERQKRFGAATATAAVETSVSGDAS